MSRIGFEPGDGSFEITLEKGEQLDSQWNVRGVIVFQENEPNVFTMIKDYNQIL